MTAAEKREIIAVLKDLDKRLERIAARIDVVQALAVSITESAGKLAKLDEHEQPKEDHDA